MEVDGEEGLESDTLVNGMRLEHVSEFKFLGYVLDESGTDGSEYGIKVLSERKVACANKSREC